MTFHIGMAHPAPPTHTHRVLLITTSHAQGASPIQLAVLHSAFTSSNVDVAIASLAGGTIPLHQDATTTKAQKELNKRFTSDENVALVESKPAWTFDGRDFDGFVLCGGPGALHDFVDNFGLRRLLQPAIAVGRPVAGLETGCSALIQLKNEADHSVVSGLRVTCPVDLESRFAAAGCSIVSSGDVVGDSCIITASATASAAELARAVMRAMPTPLEKAEALVRRMEEVQKTVNGQAGKVMKEFQAMKRTEKEFVKVLVSNTLDDIFGAYVPIMLFAVLAVTLYFGGYSYISKCVQAGRVLPL